ncbi:PilZ domain-containing protein [Vibrio sp. ZSDE26]|uniref:PilZ domain-containing protein n=1 Tax=Vibrio amylolyticus TaxID=2847292 RepID=A0A9X2BKG4_9VIBR|nr:PilZ domain-containing protein [Vibrio amylolyticus]MCK6262808.1 PilZ domain-containing protein [Vibrio amylolyticus]
MSNQEFFSVHHNMTANIEPLSSDFEFPNQETFESEIPTPFIVASEFSQLDQLSESARVELKNSDFKHVVQLLDTQNSKLNLLLTFMLSQQDDEQYRNTTHSFGASQFSYYSAIETTLDTKVRVKLFLDHPAAAIYCYGVVSHVEQNEKGWDTTIQYALLRDEDEDLLIRAALYQQQKLLRQRSLNRDK